MNPIQHTLRIARYDHACNYTPAAGEPGSPCVLPYTIALSCK